MDIHNNSTQTSPDFSNNESLRQYTLVIYILYAISILVGITSIVAIIMNYIKREEVQGTWLQSHFDWQIKTFWYTLLGCIIGFVLMLILIGYLVLAAVSIWFIYRIVKGLIVFLDNKPIGNGWF
ncbi:DUF4870 family protein [Acinetobacter populi]|jgi:uncharacterized membrane protein|uniref:Transmembrane protein n=1 Tax=Acinetobacter populi TaxID=1582270 RepID=A0A1Z9YV72_9GAMM|nr:hypothetical protein [Acinetobacter populi]MCH4248965.1 hypothetical protein [Acinetobacter populi]OUY06083.1 hypothetical protein CAP51_15415 [Acinetobacter populi]